MPGGSAEFRAAAGRSLPTIEDGIEVLEASNLAPDAVAAFEEAAGLIADAATPPPEGAW